jgi:hypothetical protein
MQSKQACLVGAAALSLCALMQPERSEDAAQNHKPVMITRLYTGPDGQTHAEEIEAKFAPGGGNDVYKLMANAGAELRRAPPGRVSD